MRVGIVGTGWVGTSIAIALLEQGFVTELLLNDVREDVAEGEAMDLSHGAPFLPGSPRVRACAVAEMRGADAVVIAAGRNGRPGESRLALVEENAAVVRAIGAELRGHAGLLFMVTNPVDVLTHVLFEATGLPAERVIGTGTLLDTARLRHLLGRELGVSPRSVHALVLGEHGDSQVALFSGARVSGRPLRAFPGFDRGREAALAKAVRGAAGEIIRRKGATNHAIGLVTAHLVKWALRDERRVLAVSRVQSADGFEDVAISLPAVVGASGATHAVLPEMDDDERARLLASAAVLRAAKAGLDGAAAKGPT